MSYGGSIQQFPHQEDKSGKPTYATAARNSSTIDPRSINPAHEPTNKTGIRELFQSMLKYLRFR